MEVWAPEAPPDSLSASPWWYCSSGTQCARAGSLERFASCALRLASSTVAASAALFCDRSSVASRSWAIGTTGEAARALSPPNCRSSLIAPFTSPAWAMTRARS